MTTERLRQIEAAEEALRRLGLRDFRVRHHGDVARLELHPSERPHLLDQRAAICASVLAAGFARALVDLEGYRRGALNEGLAPADLVQLGGGAMRAQSPLHPNPREERAEEILREIGLSRGRVTAAGHEGEIAALALPDVEFERMLGEEGVYLAARLKSLGFRYVALDLAGDERKGGGEG